MRKIYMIFVLAIIGLIANISYIFAQGTECYLPWRRASGSCTIQCGQQSYTISFSVCYYCYISANIIEYEIISYETPLDTACDKQRIMDCIRDWVMQMQRKLCGLIPCDLDPFEVWIKQPICVIFQYTGRPGYATIKKDPNCESYCIAKFRWCWCDCMQIPRPPCADRSRTLYNWDCPDGIHTGFVNWEYIGRTWWPSQIPCYSKLNRRDKEQFEAKMREWIIGNAPVGDSLTCQPKKNVCFQGDSDWDEYGR